MDLTCDMEAEEYRNSCLSLQEFCDMNQLYRLIDHWCKSSGMSAVIVDTEGNPTSDFFGMTEFCKMVHDNEKGMISCMSTWQWDKQGIYMCPAGLCDFSIPIVLPNGRILGKVIAGQALSISQKEEEIIQKTTQIGIDPKNVKDVLSRVHRKSEKEIQGSYALLKEMMSFFIEKNYSIWKNNNELKKAPEKKDRVLSQITQIMYSYNLTLNLTSGKYSLIVGTGMKDFVKIFESTDDYETAYQQKIQYVTEKYIQKFEKFSSLSALRSRKNETGYIGNLEYAAKTEKGIEWHEINIFLGTDEKGAPIANILGRDITEVHDKADTKAQLEIANASSAAKSAFLFNMSHDIRTPMNAIIGFTELLEKHLDNKELARSYIKKIQISNDFLLSLINNVLEMARIESGKMILNETYWNAYKFYDSLFELFDSQMKEKGIKFTGTRYVEHSEVMCDDTKLREIFFNILSNALKYTPAGETVTMKLTEVPSDRLGL